MKSKSMRIAQTITSLVTAVDKSGGTIDLDRSMKMSLYDFIMGIAGPNNIRFIHIPDADGNIEIDWEEA